MEVLIYQISIFIIIIISSLIGRKARDYTSLFIGIFTLMLIFTLWLMILQFVTIIVSFFITESILFNREHKKTLKSKAIDQHIDVNSKNDYYFLVTLFIIGISVYFAIQVYNNKITNKSESQKITNDTLTVDVDSNHTDYNYNYYNNYNDTILQDNVELEIKENIDNFFPVGRYEKFINTNCQLDQAVLIIEGKNFHYKEYDPNDDDDYNYSENNTQNYNNDSVSFVIETYRNSNVVSHFRGKAKLNHTNYAEYVNGDIKIYFILVKNTIIVSGYFLDNENCVDAKFIIN